MRQWVVVSLAAALTPACATGVSHPQATQVSSGGHGAYEASLAASPYGFVTAWYDTRDGNPEIYLRELDASGRPLGPERRLTDDPALSYEADVAVFDDDVIVAWYDRDESGKTGRLQARLGRWARDGAPQWIHTLSAENRNGRNPLVKVRGDQLFCVWLESDYDQSVVVWAQWWHVSGVPIGAPLRLAPAGVTTWSVNAAVGEADGEAWVVFDAAVATRADELFLVQLTPEHRNVIRLTADDGFVSKYPDIELMGDRAAITWFDERDGNREVYLLVATRDALLAGAPTERHRVTRTAGESIGAYVGSNGQRVGLAWSDVIDGQHEIFFQTFDSEGDPLASPLRVTNTSTASLIPAIVGAGPGFALAWNEDVIGARGDHRSGGRSEIVFTQVSVP